jgi:hypothetical protein
MSDNTLQKLLGLLGPNWRFYTHSYTQKEFSELVGFYMPSTTPSERDALAKELMDLY